jgi:hypothetical protein
MPPIETTPFLCHTNDIWFTMKLQKTFRFQNQIVLHPELEQPHELYIFSNA